ncbi:MAG: hypothetical protein H6658_13790 [Ardenticatenaceae bacterium]|nr:hypothetical protein [Ardenticatenaceae bacterium]
MIVDTDFRDWLLAASTPAIRYQTLSRLLALPPDDVQVQAAQQAVMSEGPVPIMLAAQTAVGPWPDESSYYTPKYSSTHWSLLLLTEWGVDGQDAGFGRGVDFMLAETAVSIANRFTNATNLDLACLWGNILRYALHAGRLHDPRTQAIITYLAQSVQNGGCQCVYNSGLGCAWGVARALWGLAAIPVADRSHAVNEALAQGVDFLLNRFSLAAADYPAPEGGKIHPLWFKLNFPLFYQTDILFVLRVLAELGALNEPGAAPALAWLVARRGRNGRWRGSSPYRSRTWACLGDRTETDRWVSLQAALILSRSKSL